jgi:long-subunit fatty acid transport protein
MDRPDGARTLSRRLNGGALLAVALFCAPLRSQAGGFHISMIGMRRSAMTTVIAQPDDVTALFHNPAGLVDLPGLQIQLSMGLAFLDSSLKLQALDAGRFPAVNDPGCGQPGMSPCQYPIGADGYYRQVFKPTSYFGAIPFLGFSLNLGRYRPRLRGLTISAALFAPGAFGASLPSTGPTSYYVTSALFVIGSAAIGVGYRINRYFAIGGNLSYNYMRLGLSKNFSTVDALTPAGQPPGTLARLAQAAFGDLTLNFDGIDHGAGWTLGVLVNPTKWLAFGASYSGWTSPTFDGEARIGDTNGDSPSALRSSAAAVGYKLPRRLHVSLVVPPNVQFGVNVTATDRVELGFDCRLWLYSLFKREVITPIYGPNDKGTEPLTEAQLSEDKGYQTSYQLNLGVLFRPLGKRRSLELMAGVGFDKSPVPDRTFSLDNPALDQAYGSIGVRDLIRKHWRVGIAYMLAAQLPRDITNSQTSPPTNVRIRAWEHQPTFEIAYVR